MPLTVRKELATRKARFRAALALARMTAREWADQAGITETHLYLVLKGARISRSLTEKIESFSEKEISEAA